jgi:NADH dehydrogenase FAD-containing subunit
LVAGDVNDCGVEKTAQNAQAQAAVAVANIQALAAGGPLRSYSAKPTPMVISLGPRHGIFSTGSFTIAGFVPALMKWAVERREMFSRR